MQSVLYIASCLQQQEIEKDLLQTLQQKESLLPHCRKIFQGMKNRYRGREKNAAIELDWQNTQK